MKSGVLNSSVAYDVNGVREKSFEYWVLPGKTMKAYYPNGRTAGFDVEATNAQTKSIKGFLTNSLEPGTWMESNHRFYFEKEEDWEMFKTMCLLGWQ